MKRFTPKQRKWALQALNKISQLKQDNAGLRQNYDTLLAQKVNLAECLTQAQRDRDALRTNRDDQINELREFNKQLAAEIASLTTRLQTATDEWRKWQKKYTDAGFADDRPEKVAEENATLRAALQAAANPHYHEQHIIDDDEMLIAGLTVLFDRMQKRALAAESREMDTP